LELCFRGVYGPPSETKIKHVRLTIQPAGHLGFWFFFHLYGLSSQPHTHRTGWGSVFTAKTATLQRDSEKFPPGQTENLVIWCMPAACVAPPPSEIACFYRNLKSGPIPRKCCRRPFGGVAGRAGAMLAIAPRSSPHVCPRQGRRRLTPKYYAAGEVIDFALVTVYGLNNGSVCPPARPLEAHAEVLCRRRRPHNYGPNIRQRWRARREANNDTNSSKVDRREC
jgi:hypothetical protein